MPTPKAEDEPVTMRTFLLLHMAVIVGAAGALWWFVVPGDPLEAVAEAVTCGLIAGYVEAAAMKRGL